MGPSSVRSSSPSSLQVPTAEDSAADSFGAGAGTVYPQWKSLDPRTSSAQSLAPSVNNDETETRRTLLIVYIHGFMGNDSSFRSFPAHVHSYLRTALAESHVIHSKIYPRYKTYKAIEVARDNFSSWLEPHESPTTDVILVGHSMGGLLAAEVVLMPSRDAQSGYPFKHRILGTISLDSPFLGLHPGIIVSGIASLFRKSPDPPEEDGSAETDALTLATDSSRPLSPDPSLYSELASHSSITSPTASNAPSASLSPGPDPFFNPPFFNDVLFKDRGWWKNVAHFAKKHKPEGLVTAARQHIINHLEFGACLMDYVALNQRYDKLRHLDDVDDFDMSSGQGGAPGPRKEARVRFVNYFTLSTGRAKSPSPTRSPRSPTRSAGAQSARSSRRGSGIHLRPEAASAPASQRTSIDGDSRLSTPRISIEDHSDGSRVEVLQSISPDDPLPSPYSEDELAPPREAAQGQELSGIAEVPGHESSESPESPSAPKETASRDSQAPQEEQEKPPEQAAPAAAESEILSKLDLPAIPEPPEPPKLHNLEAYTDKDARKQAERENKRAQKSYEQAVKNRDKAIRERQKLVEKQRKRAQKEAEKQAKEEEKRRKQDEQARKKADEEEARAAQKQSEEEQKRAKAEELALAREADELEKRLHREQQQNGVPPPSPEKKKERKFCTLPRKSNGARDPTWVEIHMEGVDEVGAHCGLFFAGPHYEKLIGDVGSRIVHWVQEDASKRAIFALADWR